MIIRLVILITVALGLFLRLRQEGVSHLEEGIVLMLGLLIMAVLHEGKNIEDILKEIKERLRND